MTYCRVVPCLFLLLAVVCTVPIAAATPLLEVVGDKAFTLADDDPAVIRRQRLDIAHHTFAALATTDKSLPDLEMRLFSGLSATLTRSRIDRVDSGFVLSGSILMSQPEGAARGEAVLAWDEDGAVAGTLTLDDRFLRIRSAVDGHQVLEEVDPSKYPQSDDALPWPRSVLTQSLEPASNEATIAGLPVADSPVADLTAKADSGNRFDLLVVYTPAARQAAGGHSAIRALINLGVAETNRAFANSSVVPRLRLVHMREVNYTEAANNGTSLFRLAVRNDGHLDEVHTLRDTYGADLVKLVGNNVNGNCGVAYILPGLDPGFESAAFSYTARVCISPNYTFGHELGHNFGCNHAPEDPTGNGAFSYSFGYKDPNERFRTMMAYNCNSGCLRQLHWSNPNRNYQGATTGTSTQNNAGSINRVRVVVANFRPERAVASSTVQLAANSFAANENDGVARITIQRVGGTSGTASVRLRTLDGSATAGTDFSAFEGTVTWSNGDSSDKVLEVPLIDDQVIENTKTFSVQLFSASGATLGNSSAEVTLEDDDVEPSVCVADDTTLCLVGGRFKVEANWRDFEDRTGPGRAVETDADGSALLWFFNAENWEMLVKVLDACGVNNRYWVFFAATTNVEYELIVTDTVRGSQRSYRNTLGTASPAVTDTSAFATCP